MPDEKAFVVVQIAIHDRDGYHGTKPPATRRSSTGSAGSWWASTRTWTSSRAAGPSRGRCSSSFRARTGAGLVRVRRISGGGGLRHDSATSNLVIVAGYPG